MTIEIRLSALPDVPQDLPLLAVRPPKWDTNTIAPLRELFALKGDARDRGAWSVITDRHASLELYRASDSFRFDRLDLHGEGRGHPSVDLDPQRAVDVAERFVERIRPDAEAKVVSVTELEVLAMARDDEEPTRTVVGLQVNYRFGVDGVALIGPGAKMQVAVSGADEIRSAYRFWRTVAAKGTHRVVPAESAVRRLGDSPMFADLQDGRARVEVTAADFGYLCLPPTEPQASLVPAYRFRGTVTTEVREGAEFVVYVGGAEMDDAEAKRLRVGQPRPSLLLA